MVQQKTIVDGEQTLGWSFGCQMLDFDKKICVQTSFSRIPLRICREEKMKQKKYCEQVQYSLKNEAIKNTTQN